MTRLLISLLLAVTLYSCGKSSTGEENTEDTTTNTNQNSNYQNYYNYPNYPTYPNPDSGDGSTPYQPYPPESISEGEGYGDGDESGISDAGQTINFYKLNNPYISVHGPNANNNGNPYWSSQTHLPSGVDPLIFKTDSRFNLRVIPRPGPARFQNDTNGVQCRFDPRQYTKLSVGIRVRKASATVGDYYYFQNVAVDSASKVHEFSVPASSDPLVVEITRVEWDQFCIDYAMSGYPNQPGYCPMAAVGANDCVSFEIQFSTDYTKDIPGTRTN
ncbi:MAG: hypothetical protein ACPGJV_15570 [Bacteriovoracaceae bacterium]